LVLFEALLSKQRSTVGPFSITQKSMFWNVFAICSGLGIQILFLLVYSTCTLVLKNYMVLTFLYHIWFVQNSCSTDFVYVYVYRSHRNIYCLKKYTIPNFNPFPFTVTIFTSIESRKNWQKAHRKCLGWSRKSIERPLCSSSPCCVTFSYMFI